MYSIRSFYWPFSKLIVYVVNSHNSIKQSSFRRFCLSGFRCNEYENKEEKFKQNKIPSSMSKYEIFSEETSPVILDIEEERRKIQEEPKLIEYDGFAEINLQRGTTGVFEVEELIEILRNEKAEDIFVVKIPDEYQYADYLVIVSGRNSRHMLAMAEFVRRVFKRKMHKSDILPKLEGKKSQNWMALDLGNIVLHVFSKSDREFYDLESLWSLGKEYDMHFTSKETATKSISEDYAKLLASLTAAKK